ncbi:hypothetical protein EYC80_004578 [Monilinia laxa]|uniref:Uncharacterized protein n=1 Tax=Monilinia laxa TaxID=61186 RepID=A0A5N6KHF6_MONLA|nr:hypothetical protein EYC80_004578 [Monilinia laxa]
MVYCQGNEITKGIFRIIACTQFDKPGVDTVVESPLYECSLAEPPEYGFFLGARIVGSVQSSLSKSFDFGKMQKPDIMLASVASYINLNFNRGSYSVTQETISPSDVLLMEMR